MSPHDRLHPATPVRPLRAHRRRSDCAAGRRRGGLLLYDVVNRKGEIIERVSFPKGRVLAGFGPGGVVYLLNTDGKSSLLERASIR